MGSLTLTNNTLDNFFSFLWNLDNNSKKRLIIKLTESIETATEPPFDLRSLFGAWEDTRDSDEIIRQIRGTRVEKQDVEVF